MSDKRKGAARTGWHQEQYDRYFSACWYIGTYSRRYRLKKSSILLDRCALIKIYALYQ